MEAKNSVKPNDSKPASRNIAELIKSGNLPQAEILLRIFLKKEPHNPEAYYLLGKIAAEVDLMQFALQYFNEAIKFAPEWKLPQISRDQIIGKVPDSVTPAYSNLPDNGTQPSEKFLLIKAWGQGLWSDVSHVLGQLLLAEITGRIPVVHWGENSLYGDGSTTDAFKSFFKPVSDVGVSDLQQADYDFWPPKWNQSNLQKSEINKFAGPYSRIAGLYLLGRQEKVIVSDFFTSVSDLVPWIPPQHHLYGLSIDELWLYLVRQYLHPVDEILNAVNGFYSDSLDSSDFIAVHARGSDKNKEVTNLYEMNSAYKNAIDRYLSLCDCNKIFLMTDDTHLLDYFREIYGDMIVTTDCHRTSESTGLHHLGISDRRQLGIEVIVDVFLAARGKAFVGNGFSNPSRFVRYLKNWPEDRVTLIGQNRFHMPNLFLHDR